MMSKAEASQVLDALDGLAIALSVSPRRRPAWTPKLRREYERGVRVLTR